MLAEWGIKVEDARATFDEIDDNNIFPVEKKGYLRDLCPWGRRENMKKCTKMYN